MSTVKFPIYVDGFKWEYMAPWFPGLCSENVGKFVAVRPIKDNPEAKTYLGLHLGNFLVAIDNLYDIETKTVINMGRHNPAILVFALNKIVFGFEIWWAVIKGEDDLRQITDADIDNTWYVKALKAFAASKEAQDDAG